MENASKALIIAGAILLAIVIISLGLIVVNNVRTTTDNTNLSEQEIQSFNAKFIAYEGNSVSGSRVNTLIQQVLASNQNTTESGKTNYVAIGFPSISFKNDENSKFYYYLYVGKNGNDIVPYASNESDSHTIENIKNKKFIKDHISRSEFPTTNKTGPTNSLSVDSGKTYKVKVGYEAGVIRYISCIANQ